MTAAGPGGSGQDRRVTTPEICSYRRVDLWDPKSDDGLDLSVNDSLMAGARSS
jgi:hypothetical protein